MHIDKAANLLAKIGNPTRLKIVRLLVRIGGEGLSVGEIQRKLKIPGSTLSHHLSHLESAGVIKREKYQTTLICKVDFDCLQSLVNFLTEECCVDATQSSDT